MVKGDECKWHGAGVGVWHFEISEKDRVTLWLSVLKSQAGKEMIERFGTVFCVKVIVAKVGLLECFQLNKVYILTGFGVCYCINPDYLPVYSD